MEEQAVNNQVEQPPVNPVSPKPNHWLIAIIILVFILIVGGVYVLVLQSQKQNSVPIPLPLDTSVKKEDPTANWKTYKNDNLGFSIQYPIDYKMEEKIFSDKTGRITLSSPDLTWEELGGGAFPKRGGEIRIEAYEDKLSIVKSAYALSYLPTPVSSYETNLDNTKATYKIEKHLLGAMSNQVLAKKDNRQFILYAFFAGGDEGAIVGIFQKILSSFKFLDQDQVVCTQDVKECPDGSYVSRQPPACEFAACPQK